MSLEELHRHYATQTEAVAAADPVSMRYYLADIEGEASSEPSLRITAWIRNLHALETFVRAHGRLPRENRRQPVERAEQRLADWMRFQRRPATRALHCQYQRLRLETVPGWQWAPVEENWVKRAAEYETFRDDHGRAPRYRSHEQRERSLAAWAAKQRLRHRRGSHFSEDELRIMRRLRIIPTAGSCAAQKGRHK